MTDTELYRLAARGDDRAFSELAKRYESMVYNVAYSILDNDADACDASQEALLRIWSSAKKYRGECTVKTWIYGITKNASLDVLRQRGRASTVPLDEAAGISAGDNAEDAAMRNDAAHMIRAAINEIPVQFREVLQLRYMYDMDYEEIANTVNAPVGTVKSRLSRAREMLAENLRGNTTHSGTKRQSATSKRVNGNNEG